jgi:HAD superfamily hydrolase (TIGR01509 family)
VTTTEGPPWAAAALFDWDGTLVDSRQALLAAWHDVTSMVLGRAWPVEDDDVRVILSRRGVEVFPSLSDDPTVVQALAEAFTPAYERHAAEGVRPFPGAARLLEELNDRGVAVGVVTSKARERFTADAARGRLAHLIAAATCAEDVLRGKPDPQAALSVLEQLCLPAERAVMVGDAVVDIMTGRAAGIRSIGVTWGSTPASQLVEAGADVVVETFDDLHAALSAGPLAI